MNAQKLSKRLERVAAYVPQNAVVADIGSDHAYLPCYLVHQGVASKAIAGEVVKGPYESACKEVKREKLQDKIEVRLADGMEAVDQQDAVDTVTIAGMGGPLIAAILNKDLSRLHTVKRLILQPNIHAMAIRTWAQKNEWQIIAEEILSEDDKIYEILVLERGTQKLTELELLMGPFLVQEKNAVFMKKWQGEINQWERIIASIENVEQTPAIIEKRQELNEKLTVVRSVL